MNELEITFPLEKAVIYPQCAGLTRACAIQFRPGENRLLIRNLPEAITEDSVRMELLPDSVLKIQEVYTDDRILSAYDENLYRKTKAELDVLLHNRSLLEVSYKNTLDEFNIFYDKGSITSTLDNQLHRPLSAENWDAFFVFLEEKLKMNREKAREILFGWFTLQREIEAGAANLEKYAAYEQVKAHRIVALIQSPADVQELIRIHYLQEGVQWHPAYRIRADIEQQQIAVSLYAMISQNTGEDWKDIAVELSTAVPMVNCDLPAVLSRQIQERSAEIITNKTTETAKDLRMELDEAISDDLAAPEPKMKARRKAGAVPGFGGKMEKEKGAAMAQKPALARTIAKKADTAASTAPPPSVKAADYSRGMATGGEASLLTNLVNEEEQQLYSGLSLSALPGAYQELYAYMKLDYTPESRLPGTTGSGINPFFARGISPLTSLGGYDYRYQAGSRKNFIPSLGTPIQLGVDIRELAMHLVYVTIPYAEEAVFLKALFANRDAGPLPAGPAQVFVENTFIGNINFPTLGRNKGTALSLGIENDIKVKRTQTSNRRTTGLVAKGMLVDFRVEIEIASYKAAPAAIEVYDRLPVPKISKEIPVLEETFDPEPWKITDDKIIIWKVRAEPGKKLLLKFQYTIKHPENYQLELTEGGSRYSGEEI